MPGPLDLAAIMIVMVFLALGAEAVANAVSNRKNDCCDDRVEQLEKKIEELSQIVGGLRWENGGKRE